MTVYTPHPGSRVVDEVGKLVTGVGGTLTPVLVATDSVGGEHDIINTEQLSDFCLTVCNEGANAITEVTLEHAPTPEGPWEVRDNTHFATPGTPLAAGATKSLENIENRRKFMRIRAKTAGPSTDVRCYLFGTFIGVSD